jgi:methyl-accepting chemotaxis protein
MTKDALSRRLILVFGLMIAMVATVALMATVFSMQMRSALQAFNATREGTTQLALANDSLWRLRYNTSTASTAELKAVKQLLDEEAGHIKAVNDALRAYSETPLTEAERAALTTAQKAMQVYADVRPVYYQLRLDGKDEEAKLYRKNNLTPRGAELVKSMVALVELQARAAEAGWHSIDGQAVTYRSLAMVFGLLAVLGAVALAVWLVQVITGPVAQASALAGRIAQGDLSVRVPEASGPMAGLLEALSHMQRSLAGVAAQVRDNANTVAEAGGVIARGTEELSSRTDRQRASLTDASRSIDELGGAIRENLASARQANDLAQGAAGVAQRGGTAMTRVVDTMKRIQESSRRIADIIGVIDGIAFQTNILALNAAVEAARAGDQGRGFAVVAGEVRQLAQRSADAAREIKELIGSSVERVEQGTTLVDEAGGTMQEIVAAIDRVTGIMSAITTASEQQSAGVAAMGGHVASMDRATVENAALVDRSATASDDLKLRADRLVQAVSVFKLTST